MAFDNNVIVVGNVTRDPELRYTTNGAALVNLSIAWNNKYKGRDGQQVEDTSFFDVVCWRDLAENVAESINRGDRVTVYGRLDQRSWETDNGDKRSKVEIVADEVCPSLRWATATVNKIQRDGPPRGGNQGGGASTPPPPTEPYGEEPF